MLSPLTLLTAIILSALNSSATPAPIVVRDNLIRLPFAKHVNITSAKQIVLHDQARAAALKSRRNATVAGVRRQDVPATDSGTYYAANVSIGTPGTSYALLIDTGSSNTFVGTSTPYQPTGSSIATGHSESVSYGSGSWSGDEYLDTVSLSPDLTVTNQSIGVATKSQGFSGIDGILGLGPKDLTEGTVSGQEIIPTVTDNLFSQGSIQNNLVSVYFQPSVGAEGGNGELTFGDVDETKVVGELSYASITTVTPASEYWGIDQTISYGLDNGILTSAGIVDTGSTLLLLATDAFQDYQQLTGAVMDNDTSLLRINPDQFADLQSLFFNISGVTFEFIPDAQIWPRAMNEQIGGSSEYIYLIVSDLGSHSGSGLDFISGMAWLERYYSVYDTGNKQVGIANTVFTDAIVNSIA